MRICYQGMLTRKLRQSGAAVRRGSRRAIGPPLQAGKTHPADPVKRTEHKVLIPRLSLVLRASQTARPIVGGLAGQREQARASVPRPQLKVVFEPSSGQPLLNAVGYGFC